MIAERYLLVRVLGRGGMGEVWQAYDELLHRKVAVKQLLMPAELGDGQASEARRRAVREARIAARLQHKNVIALFDVLDQDGTVYLIMEYLPSRTLTQEIAEHGTLPVAEAARIGAQIADGLHAAHQAGVVHRDVKPGNVLLGADGTVKITDFGIARAVGDAGTTSSELVVGTPAYMSPEVAKGERPTFASDVYSLGATLCTAIEGTPPVGYSDNAMALLYRAASGEITPPSHAGPITDILGRMLDADPGRRPPMPEVRDTLSALPAIPDQPTTELPRERPPDRRRRRVAVPVAAAALLVAGGIVTVLLDRPTSPEQTSAQPPVSPSTLLSTSSTTSSTTTPPSSSQPPPATTLAAPVTPDGPATITGYYALMPGNLTDAWIRLTPKYQQHPAGGRSGYQRFWSQIGSVRVSAVTPLADNVVEATVEYHFKDGRVVVERHHYTLIRQDRQWKIDESTVLSSRTLAGP
jgi:serine/threonine protein kinase